jgi:hypothetical protein
MSTFASSGALATPTPLPPLPTNMHPDPLVFSLGSPLITRGIDASIFSPGIITSCHVVFNEDVFPLANSSLPPDLDSLLELDYVDVPPLPLPSSMPRATRLPPPAPHTAGSPAPGMALLPLPVPRAAPLPLPVLHTAPSPSLAPRVAPPLRPLSASFVDPARIYQRRARSGLLRRDTLCPDPLL